MVEDPIITVSNLTVAAGRRLILRSANFVVERQTVFGLIGPSGAGKSTLLRCLNRLIDLTPQIEVGGDVLLDGHSVYAPGVDVNALRERVGIIFQQPAVFPRSILANVLFGAQRLGKAPRARRMEIAERALREAVLCDEVKDRLHDPAQSLSVGQQQRLCIACTLAVSPEVILMDEPTSALDPRSTRAIENLILELRKIRTIVLVTHNVEQARRVTDWLACVCVRDGAGEIVESACCDALLGNPQCREVINYLSEGAIGSWNKKQLCSLTQAKAP